MAFEFIIGRDMFTGIVEARGEVLGIDAQGAFSRLRIRSSMELADVREGDSISVDGACLTATRINAATGEFAADVSPETLKVTTLGSLKRGDSVNLEKALMLSDRLGGHLVLGHVDCVGQILEKQIAGTGFLLGFQVDSSRYLIEKGSVAVDGVSLTVNKVLENRFWVMVIPHTGMMTGLTEKKIGDKVNIEYDMIGKYVEKFISKQEKDSSISEQKLKDFGFM